MTRVRARRGVSTRRVKTIIGVSPCALLTNVRRRAPPMVSGSRHLRTT